MLECPCKKYPDCQPGEIAVSQRDHCKVIDDYKTLRKKYELGMAAFGDIVTRMRKEIDVLEESLEMVSNTKMMKDLMKSIKSAQTDGLIKLDKKEMK